VITCSITARKSGSLQFGQISTGQMADIGPSERFGPRSKAAGRLVAPSPCRVVAGPYRINLRHGTIPWASATSFRVGRARARGTWSWVVAAVSGRGDARIPTSRRLLPGQTGVDLMSRVAIPRSASS
jgi:hypothetical protein